MASLPPKIYQWPMWVVGSSGSGKSWLLANLALRLNRLGEGLLVIDHKDGQLATDLAVRADPDALIYLSPGQCYFNGHPHHWGLNILEVPRRDRLGFDQAHDNTMHMFSRMERANFSFMQQMRLHLDTAIRAVLYLPEPTIAHVLELLTDYDLRQRIIADPRIPPPLRDHFVRFDKNTAYGKNQNINSSIPRLMEFLTNQTLYFMVTQCHSTIRLSEWLDAGKMVVVGAATNLTDSQSELLGNLLLAHYMNATFTRRVNKSSRTWRVVADEFDQLAGDNFIQLIHKARSFKSLPIMANQELSQLVHDHDDRLLQAVKTSRVIFTLNLSADNAAKATWIRHPEIDPSNLRDHTAVMTLRDGLPSLLDPRESALILLDPLEEVD